MRATPATALQSEINVTPLVDVCLVLLIIFMVLFCGGQAILPVRKAVPSVFGQAGLPVRGDKNLAYGDVVRVLDICRAAGFQNVGLATTPLVDARLAK